ncbi:pentatricopeptide repeat-containing protein At5g62370 [Mercurialis annua]|uniref:pentatricopeptide repeat-containing protein At5g62370 n=1 Tax=Mercurialis annua TaxID=3986 RepID=UPI00215F1DA2|nr:pentatricopeptide repeat-containing protein At5g62370 [Mercurialis annua]XP_050217030.1 pentatricopeptide repeat-containing protein At5g62370 [Mercurialis annua]XP_050217031.1 pentatricopeptide repeat-containing protein At5g62370 [Mercurialis annua]XP_050217032.1 pentatricopeptide repeat-containing protein At5g62370 [Mercurialis annua]XP_050217033.1 pentatricopeptide repeat-containing protein At5g62370 [Mercurialis annua]XP_055960544.1 pentatricopeptide repeat-containing protein At5g62370 [
MLKCKPPDSSYYSLFFFYFKNTKKSIVTSTAPLPPPPPPPPQPPSTSKLPINHKALCVSLADNLFRRGQLYSAQQLIQRIIAQSSTVPDAISTVDFASTSGINLTVGIFSAFIRKLVDLGQPNFAHTVYCESVIGRGIEPDCNIINSMIICFVKLGKLEDAKFLFDKLIANGCVPCHAACNVILKEFCVKDLFLEAFDCLVKISNVKVQLGMWCYNVLIDGLSCKGLVGEALQVVDIMRKRSGFLPTLHNFKSLFYGLCKRGWVVEAESVCGEMEAQGFFVDRVMYTTLMNAYAKDKNIKMAVMIFLRMLRMGCGPDCFSYTVLIQGMFKMGFFDEGWKLYEQMNESMMLPDAVIHHVMISNFCNIGKLDCAIIILKNMTRQNLVPSVHSYTALIAALYKDNRITEIDELYKSMLDHGIFPDHVLFLIFMKNSLRGNELQLCLLILQEILKHGCGLEPSLLCGSPNRDLVMTLEQEIELLLDTIVRSNFKLASLAFCIYITALCERGKSNAALACLKKMEDVRCTPLPFTFNSLIKCIFGDGHFEHVESLITIMQDRRIVPDLGMYTVMVNKYCQRNDLKSAFFALNQMEERGFKPSVAIYDCIIRCLSREKRMFEAETLFQRMLKAGVDPDAVVYVTMINGYFRNGRSPEALQFFEKMIQNAILPSLHSYTAVICGLVKNNEIDKGCVYLDRMLRAGFVPNAVFYTSLVYHFLRKGEFNFSFRLIDLMKRSQIKFDLVLCTALVSGICRDVTWFKNRFCKVNRASVRMRERLLQLLHQKTVLPMENILRFSAHSPEEMKSFALKLLRETKESLFLPNLYLYNCIIAGFCWADRIDEAYIQFELMQREGICPNEVTFTILIGAHSRAGEINSAIELFNLMNANVYRPDRVTYNTLVRGLCNAGRELESLSLFYAMQKRGFFPDKVSYENLLRLFCARCLAVPAFMIFEEMIALNYVPRRYSTQWLLDILHEEKKLHEAHIVSDMASNRATTKSTAKPSHVLP